MWWEMVQQMVFVSTYFLCELQLSVSLRLLDSHVVHLNMGIVICDHNFSF